MKRLVIWHSISVLAMFPLSTAPFSKPCYTASVFLDASSAQPGSTVMTSLVTPLLLVYWRDDLFTRSFFLFDCSGYNWQSLDGSSLLSYILWLTFSESVNQALSFQLPDLYITKIRLYKPYILHVFNVILCVKYLSVWALASEPLVSIFQVFSQFFWIFFFTLLYLLMHSV